MGWKEELSKTLRIRNACYRELMRIRTRLGQVCASVSYLEGFPLLIFQAPVSPVKLNSFQICGIGNGICGSPIVIKRRKIDCFECKHLFIEELKQYFKYKLSLF